MVQGAEGLFQDLVRLLDAQGVDINWYMQARGRNLFAVGACLHVC